MLKWTITSSRGTFQTFKLQTTIWRLVKSTTTNRWLLKSIRNRPTRKCLTPPGHLHLKVKLLSRRQNTSRESLQMSSYSISQHLNEGRRRMLSSSQLSQWIRRCRQIIQQSKLYQFRKRNHPCKQLLRQDGMAERREAWVLILSRQTSKNCILQVGIKTTSSKHKRCLTPSWRKTKKGGLLLEIQSLIAQHSLSRNSSISRMYQQWSLSTRRQETLTTVIFTIEQRCTTGQKAEPF